MKAFEPIPSCVTEIASQLFSKGPTWSFKQLLHKGIDRKIDRSLNFEVFHGARN
jgi:hypothetical protein